MWHNLSRWRGIVLITLALVATLWLAGTERLTLYIHPRYVIFTVLMAVIALVLVLASFLLRPGLSLSLPELPDSEVRDVLDPEFEAAPVACVRNFTSFFIFEARPLGFSLVLEMENLRVTINFRIK